MKISTKLLFDGVKSWRLWQGAMGRLDVLHFVKLHRSSINTLYQVPAPEVLRRKAFLAFGKTVGSSSRILV